MTHAEMLEKLKACRPIAEKLITATFTVGSITEFNRPGAFTALLDTPEEKAALHDFWKIAGKVNGEPDAMRALCREAGLFFDPTPTAYPPLTGRHLLLMAGLDLVVSSPPSSN